MLGNILKNDNPKELKNLYEGVSENRNTDFQEKVASSAMFNWYIKVWKKHLSVAGIWNR